MTPQLDLCFIMDLESSASQTAYHLDHQKNLSRRVNQ